MFFNLGFLEFFVPVLWEGVLEYWQDNSTLSRFNHLSSFISLQSVEVRLAHPSTLQVFRASLPFYLPTWKHLINFVFYYGLFCLSLSLSLYIYGANCVCVCVLRGGIFVQIIGRWSEEKQRLGTVNLFPLIMPK